MSKNTPMRKCVGCGISKPKDELVRIACDNGNFKADTTGRMPGRGVYICCGSEKCFNAAVKKRAIGRAAGCELTAENADDLRKELFGDEK